MIKDKEKCPYCDKNFIPIGNQDNFNCHGFICPNCFWEIDKFTRNFDDYSVSNHQTLRQAIENYKTLGACDKQMLKYK